MKKHISFMIILLIFVSSIAGCGSTDQVNNEQPSNSENQGSVKKVDYPGTNQVNILVGYGAGGSSDIGVRMLQPYLEKELDTTVNVINKPGANGWIAWTDLSKAKPDGLTIALVNIPGFYSGYLDKQQNRSENLESFDFIANHVTDWGVLVAKKGQFENMEDFMKNAKSSEVTIGDVGMGGNKHIQIEELKNANPDAKLTPIHMKGFAENYAGLLGGHIDAVSATMGDIISQMSEGELEVLCVFAPERSEMLPDVQTCEELGFGQVYGPSSRGYMLPKGVDQEVVSIIEEAFKKAINDPEQISKMRELGLAVDYFDGEEYDAFLKENETKLRSMTKLLGWE
ncbi:tripartite tricarboxylate transporter substrate binding protein [Acidaminobacter hydrogenoformans]|uniref:Tripartite-type tricarboxylate transporter, receptor component TctC n=1 Tax=Acidaminobacter hydrogenoformans DSM 2784 TaxID=1120920 RepID=A0A1G5S1S0_9FIRM|nr:tripartite tricarboxylate transporter substrate binding protein [Acidaminobacter hydrogenoformans]SCZ79509.1 Tripartite-type tricarboxylate transporter, receptor component TctC [Acidaminobacter hydrogenoformans DSM 2784]